MASCKTECPKPRFVFDVITDERDGKKYRTITLNSTTKDGRNIENTWFIDLLSYEAWNYDAFKKNKDESRIESLKEYKMYFVDEKNERFGAYATNIDSLCPNGWHIPTKENWDTLFLQLNFAEGIFSKSHFTGMAEAPKYGLAPDNKDLTYAIFFPFFESNSKKNSVYTVGIGKSDTLHYYLIHGSGFHADFDFTYILYSYRLKGSDADKYPSPVNCYCVKNK
jgi:uncharacterized protein (TIGR02145 family)